MPPVLRALTEQSLELPQRLSPLRLGVGMDQIIETLGLGQIELAVLECAPRKLARLRRPQAVDPAELLEDRGKHGAAAVHLQFGDVFAGRTVRSRKEQHHRIVDGRTGRVAQRGESRNARRGQVARRAFAAHVPAAGPEMRTTAIAAGGRPLDSAKIVSRAISASHRTDLQFAIAELIRPAERVRPVAGRILAEDLFAARTDDNVVAKLHAHQPQFGDLGLEIIDLDHEPVPAAGLQACVRPASAATPRRPVPPATSADPRAP